MYFWCDCIVLTKPEGQVNTNQTRHILAAPVITDLWCISWVREIIHMHIVLAMDATTVSGITTGFCSTASAFHRPAHRKTRRRYGTLKYELLYAID